MRSLAQILITLALSTFALAAAGDGRWLSKVPAKDRARSNPFAANADGPAAGAKIFAEHCAQCHGAAGEGKVDGKHYKPSLRSRRVQQVQPGELFWLLTNGSLRNGMPSWSRLPDAQRWQVITFVESLR